MPDEYEQLRQCWLNVHRLEFLSERIGRLQLEPGSHVLEVGSGTGWLLRHLAATYPELLFTGLEPDPTYVRFARERAAGNEEHVCGTAEQFEAVPERYALILSNDVLHHVVSQSRTVRNLARASARGAHWWAIEPNALNPYTWVRQQFTYGERNFLPRPFLDVARAAGWQLQERRFLFLIPPFVRTAPRFLRRLERRFEWIPPVAGGVSLQLRLGV